MRRRLRLMVAMLGLVLGLHVFMLAGLGDHHEAMPAGDGMTWMAARSPAGAVDLPAPVGHDMAVGCLAVLAGVVLLGAGLHGGKRRWMPEPEGWPVTRAIPPSRPPPIALGVLRT